MAAEAAVGAALLARRILNAFPPDRLLRTGGPAPHSLVLGATALARELCRGLLRLCHFRHGRPPVLSVAAMPGSIASIEDFLPGAGLVGEVRAIAVSTGDAAGLLAGLADLPPVTAIYACVAWDLTSLRTLFDGFPPPLVSTAAGADGGGFPCFGAADAGTGNGFDDGEAVARAIHGLYLQEQLARGQRLGDWPTLVPWDGLSDGDRDGNRFLADHIRVKLRDVGCSLRPTRQGGLQFTPRELDELARAEHRRWSAVRLLAGFRYGATRDDGRKRHPDLVPFEQLSLQKQDLDRIAVRATDAYLARAGLGVVRDAPVAVLAAPRAELAPGFAGKARALFGELARHYPDRRIALRADLRAPAAREFCAFAKAAAGWPLTAVSADAPPAAEAWPLLNKADRIEVCDRGTDLRDAVRRGTRLAIRIAAAPEAGAGREVVLDRQGRVLARPWRD